MTIARLRHTRDIAHPIIEIIDSASSSVAGYMQALVYNTKLYYN